MVPELGPTDGPSRITMCTENALITGFQVFYGEYNEIAGSSHGDLSTDCTNTLINTNVAEIALYGSATGQYLDGMTITLQPLEDAAYPGQIIEAGTTEQIGQKKRSISINYNEDKRIVPNFMDFFGFESASKGKTLLNVRVIMYNKAALYRSRFSSSIDTATQREMLGSYVNARRSFNNILENRAKALLPEPSIFGDIQNVYRPEDRDADQREIQKIIRDIKRKQA